VAYNYHSNEVWLVNRFRERSGARIVEVEVINPDGTEVSHTTHEINTTANSAKLVGAVEGLDEADGVAFLRLILRDGDGEVLSRNVYWVAQAVDELDWENSTWYHTPVTSFADYTSLFGMETASVSIASSPKEGQQGTFTVTLENEATVPAFFIRLNLVDGDGNDVNPVTWSDNYVTLWPGETLELTVNGWDGTGKTVLIDGVNVEASNFTLQ
jgi:exo-1,4-beta-D-glucosaminidase